MKTVLLYVFSAVFSITCFAIPEVQFQTSFKASLTPFNEHHLHTGQIIARDGVKLAYATYLNVAGAPSLVFVPGRTEFYLKYQELAFDLFQRGYSVFILDPRGQGLSQRLLDNPQIGYVKKFDDYVTDLELFMDKIVRPQSHGKIFILGHSMGGAIALLFVAAHPEGISALAVTSAMVLPNTAPYGETQAEILLDLLSTVGRSKDYAPGRGPYKTIPSNDSTQSKERAAMIAGLIEQEPALALGGPSNQWVSESLKASRKLRFKLKGKVTVPLFMINAAVDQTVITQANEDFCKATPGCATLTISDSSHEILQERDQVRNLALKAILDFFNHH